MDNDSMADAASTSVSSGADASDFAELSHFNTSPLQQPPPPPPPPKISLEHSYGDLEAWLAKLTQGTPLTEPEVKQLTELARERLLQESNVQPVRAPVTICGDIHVRYSSVVCALFVMLL
jgi:hypothetical protein